MTPGTSTGFDLLLADEVNKISDISQVTFIEYNASPDMENNFYYDSGYEDMLRAIYEKVLYAMERSVLGS